jgi:hypothetical protein
MPILKNETLEAFDARIKADALLPPPLPDARALDTAAWRIARQAALNQRGRDVATPIFDGTLASEMDRPSWARASAALRGGRIR